MKITPANQKQTNARIMKWRQMMKEGLVKDPELLVRRCRKGIPSSMRIKIYPEIIKKLAPNLRKAPLTYSTLLMQDSHYVTDIKLDITRTFNKQVEKCFQTSLFNVLRALSSEFPQIGYCQGMNFLAMRLLEIIDDDNTFYVISYLIRKHKNIYDGFANPGFIEQQNSTFTVLLEKCMPKVGKLLKAQNIPSVLYTPTWFLTLFSKSLPSEKFYRFMDIFLVEGIQVLYKTALGIVRIMSRELLQNTSEDNLMLLSNEKYLNSISDDEFVENILAFEVTKEDILKAQQKYAKAHQHDIQKLQESVKVAYECRMTSSNSSYEWTIEDYNQASTKFLKFDDQMI